MSSPWPPFGGHGTSKVAPVPLVASIASPDASVFNPLTPLWTRINALVYPFPGEVISAVETSPLAIVTVASPPEPLPYTGTLIVVPSLSW